MTDLEVLKARIRFIIRLGTLIVSATLVAFGVSHGWWNTLFKGLMVGEAGGAYVVYSLLRQGHLNDGLQGAALFAAGVVGMVMRFLVLGMVMFIAYKVHANFVATLIGYLSGFILIFFGLSSYLRKPTSTSAGK
jgi:hypothetical protein